MKNLDVYVVVVLVIIVVGIFGTAGYIIINEDNPEYQMKLVETGTVISAGCVNGTYKSHITYDCSIDIEWAGGIIERLIINSGVLPGDKIGKFCGSPIFNDYTCRYGRVK